MKHTLSFLLLLSLLSFFSFSSKAQTAVDAYGQLSVQGTQIVSENGAPVQLRGMSLFWSQWHPEYYDYNTVKWLKDDWCINVIRIAMAASQGGYESNPQAELTKVRTVIDAALDLGIYVIVDFHDHYAHEKTAMAQEFFSIISTEYGNHPNIIYEIFNEPLNISWSNDIKPYAETVISTIRENDANNIIIVGTPNWSQDVEDASYDPINLPNIAYTLHYYAATHKQSLRNKALEAIDNGICLFATEYGTCEANGDGFVDVPSSNTWWDFLDQYNIGHCNWSVADKQEAASAITPNTSPAGNWTSANLTTSGALVRNEIKSHCPDYGDVIDITPLDIPGRVEAEDYSGMSGVRTEATEDIEGSFNIGYTDAGDFVQYQINAIQAGDYDLTYRIATQDAGGSFDLLVDGNFVHSVEVPSTGDWQTWEDYPESLNLTSGEHTLRIEITGGGFNLNYMDFDYSGSATGITVPGLVEAEHYVNMNGIEVEATADAPPGGGDGFNIGYIDVDDFVEYQVVASYSGVFDFNYRVASDITVGAFDLYVDGNYEHSVSVPETGGWQTWQTLTLSVELTEGPHTLRLVATGNGWNLNYIEVQPQVVASSADATLSGAFTVFPNPASQKEVHIHAHRSSGEVSLFNAQSILLSTTTLENGEGTLSTESLAPGIYVLKHQNHFVRLTIQGN